MKTKNRIKLTQPSLKTRTDVELALNDIVLTTINRNRALLAMDAEIAAARERHEANITACNQALAEKTDLIRAWAEANPSEFHGLKSLDLLQATIGWRTGNPALKLLSGWSWKKVVAVFKGSAFWNHYIRTKEEVDRAALLSDRKQLQSDDLREVGLKVVQEESFFIEPKLTEPDNRQHQAA